MLSGQGVCCEGYRGNRFGAETMLVLRGASNPARIAIFMLGNLCREALGTLLCLAMQQDDRSTNQATAHQGHPQIFRDLQTQIRGQSITHQL